VCKTCGEKNADRNASFNIAYRALGYISKVGVTVNIPITLASTDRTAIMTRETRKETTTHRPVVVHSNVTRTSPTFTG
jgi:transposase